MSLFCTQGKISLISHHILSDLNPFQHSTQAILSGNWHWHINYFKNTFAIHVFGTNMEVAGVTFVVTNKRYLVVWSQQVTRPSYGLNLTTLRVYMTQDD
jgi:hypothetical protein